MARLKKLDPEWKPAENPYLKVGGIIEITDYSQLVRQSKAILVDERGNEIPLPDEILVCPVCFRKIQGSLNEFSKHIQVDHAPKSKTGMMVVEEIKEEETETTQAPSPLMKSAVEIAKERRLEALAVARGKTI